ncbi:MAG: DbpA RNA binding domain-containing protein [Geodermatophilaceae bacterium]
MAAIEIADRFSLVEVPEDSADEVIAALRPSTIKDKSVQVRRDRGGCWCLTARKPRIDADASGAASGAAGALKPAPRRS